MYRCKECKQHVMEVGDKWLPWGTPLDLMLNVVGSEELRRVRGVVEEMDKRGDYGCWCGADLTLIIREIDKELMCRREGVSRMEMEKRTFLEAQTLGEETSAPEDRDLGAGDKDSASRADQIPVSSKPTPLETGDGAEWV